MSKSFYLRVPKLGLELLVLFLLSFLFGFHNMVRKFLLPRKHIKELFPSSLTLLILVCSYLGEFIQEKDNYQVQDRK